MQTLIVGLDEEFYAPDIRSGRRYCYFTFDLFVLFA